MARLKKHGRELDRREYPTHRVAIMSDGQIMRDCGSGWKLWKQVKEGFDVAEIAREHRAKYDARPASFHAYMQALQAATCLKYRSTLHEAVSLMPGDPDGVWVNFNDFSYDAEIDLHDAVELCGLWRAVELDYPAKFGAVAA